MIECTKVLLAAGATVNHRITNGRTPLDIALTCGVCRSAAGAKTVELLEAAGGLRGADVPDEDDDDSDDEIA